MTGTQISNMDPSVTLPDGAVVPFVVPPATPGFDPALNYIYDLGADLLTRVSYTALAAPTAAAQVGSTDGNVQADIDARPTTAALASSTGGAMVGLEDGNTIQQLSTAQTEAILYSSLYPSLKDAIATWMAAGGTLIINQDYLTETSVFGTGDGTFAAGKTYRLQTQGARTIKYTGAATHLPFHRWYAGGAATLSTSGDLTIDSDNKCGTGLFVDFTGVSGADRRDCTIDGIKTKNNRLNTAYSLGANGIVIRGGFDFLRLRNFRVENVTRAAGSGSAGSYGSAGVQIFDDAGSTATAKRIEVTDGEVINVTAEDTVGTTAYQDMDGLLIFQRVYSGDPIVAPVIRNIVFRECVGRAVKRFATAFGGVTEQIKIFRSVRGKYTGATEIAHQDGSGIIRDIEMELSGNANVEPGIPIIIAPSAALANGGGTVQRVRITDTTGAPLPQIVSISQGFTDANPRTYVFDDVKHSGTAQAFIRLGQAAAAAGTDTFVTLRDVVGEFTQGLGQSDDLQTYLKVECFNVVNRGSAVAAMVQNNGNLRVSAWGDWWGNDGCTGIKRYVPVWRGNAAFTNGLRGPGGGCLDAPPRGASEVYGRTPLRAVTIAPSATYNFPPFGSNQSNGGDFTVKIVRRDASVVAPVNLRAAAGTTTLDFLFGSAPGSWDIRSTGSGSGAGSNVEVWKDSGTQGLVIENRTAVALTVEVTFNP